MASHPDDLANDRMMPAEPGLALCVRLMQSVRVLLRHLEQVLAEWNLSGPRLGVLRSIDEVGGTLRLSQISHRMQISCADVTAIVDRLEADGLVVRERSSEDRRVILAHVTPEGHRRSVEAHRASAQALAELLEFLPVEEQEAMGRHLDEIRRRIEEGVPGCPAPPEGCLEGIGCTEL